MHTIIAYKVLTDYRIWVRFGDGFESTVCLRPLLNQGIALELLDMYLFNKVSVETGGGLVWENGFDICPNTLRELIGKKVLVA